MEKLSSLTSSISASVSPQPSERVPLRPQIVTWPIPPPHPAVSLPTPDELHLMRQTEKARAATTYNEELRAGAEDVTGDGRAVSQRALGLWKVVKGFTQRTATEMSAGTSRLLREQAINKDQAEFAAEFPQIAESGATHLGAYECVTCHSGAWWPCTVHVTSTHLCVLSNCFIDTVPFKMIASIIPSVALPTADAVPLLVEVPDPRVVVTALQVYTTTKKCLLFSQFTDDFRHKLANQAVKELSPVMQVYTTIDRAWRAEQRVPVPDVDYATKTADR